MSACEAVNIKCSGKGAFKTSFCAALVSFDIAITLAVKRVTGFSVLADCMYIGLYVHELSHVHFITDTPAPDLFGLFLPKCHKRKFYQYFVSQFYQFV